MNGLQIANLLNGKPVIFATAYKEYAAEAFDLNAIDYIRKPIKLERLQQAVRKVVNHLEKNEQPDEKSFIQINTDRGKAIIYFDQLCYIRTSENDSRDKIARLFDGKEFTLKNISFDSLMAKLPSPVFCRINKKEVISLRSVQVFSYDEITTSIEGQSGTNLKLTLSEKYRNTFLQKINT